MSDLAARTASPGDRQGPAPALPADLLHERAFVAGRWVASAGGGTFPVSDPADGSLLARVADLTDAEVAAAVAAAGQALQAWRSLLPRQRGARLTAWHDLIVARREDLARLITAEEGKPLAEALGEVDYGASFLSWFAEEGNRHYGETIPSHLPGRKLLVQHEPLGVVGLVTPWNFPLAMLARKAAAALAAGCTVVAHPSSLTPLSALALADLAARAEIPPGVFSVVTGEARRIVGLLCASETLRGLSFTGSTEVGREIFRPSAGSLKRLSLELGGHAPFIVFPDADLQQAVEAAVAAKFQTSGQDCLAANRIYVHRALYEPFAAAFAARTAALPVGRGTEPGVAIGPLAHEGALRKVSRQVADAVARGARLMTGGRPHRLGGLFYEPTVLADVTAAMEISREETFGPVAALLPFESEAAVIAAANASPYGLAAYVYSAELSRALRVADALQIYYRFFRYYCSILLNIYQKR